MLSNSKSCNKLILPQEYVEFILSGFHNITPQTCQCGVRKAQECPGAWEKGCDLGSNPNYVSSVDPSDVVKRMKNDF